MFFGSIFLLIMFILLKYVLAWIAYVNKLDSRLGDSTGDGPMIIRLLQKDYSDLDDKEFIRLRGKNKLVTIMYSILIIFVSFMGG